MSVYVNFDILSSDDSDDWKINEEIMVDTTVTGDSDIIKEVEKCRIRNGKSEREGKHASRR